MEKLILLLSALPKIFLSWGAMWLMVTSGNSISDAKQYELSIAEYKLSVGSALNQVQKQVSNTLEKTAATPTIAPDQKREIEELTQKTNAVLEKAAEDIEGKSEKLLDEEVIE